MFKLWAVPIGVALIGTMIGGPVVGLLAGIFAALVWPTICVWREQRSLDRLTAKHLAPPPSEAERGAEQARQDGVRSFEQAHQERLRQEEVTRQKRKIKRQERNRLFFSHPMDYFIGGFGLFGIWLIFHFALR